MIVIATKTKKLYTLPQFAKAIGVSGQTVRNWMNEGTIKADQTTEGGHYRFTAAQVRKFLNEKVAKETKELNDDMLAAKIKEIEDKVMYTCTICGRMHESQGNYFHKSSASVMWSGNNKYTPFCKRCIEVIYEDTALKYGSKRTATMIICHYLDVPFYADVAQNLIENNIVYTFGMYSKMVQFSKNYMGKTFVNTLLDKVELIKSEDNIRETREAKWTTRDKNNRKYVESIVGYDCFDTVATSDEDRRFCFNLMARYCDDDSVKYDSHKTNSCIEIVNMQLQVAKLNELINEELGKNVIEEAKIQKLVVSKKSMLDGISKLAQDNNISSNFNDSSKVGVNTLTERMKQIERDGYELVKPNLYNIKTAEIMKQVANISIQAINDQLAFDSNDYAEMIKEQRVLIEKLQEDNDRLVEENRQYENMRISKRSDQVMGV